jgi:GT2 family glycosyltransferase
MMPLDLSILTVSHNHFEVIRSCVTSLYALPDRSTFETLLIDNTGADPTAAWMRIHRPEVRVLANRSRQGFAANVNTGMRALQNGRYFLLLNPDVICLPGLLDRLVAFMDGNPDVAIAAPQLFDADGSVQPNCRRFPTPGVLAFRAFHLDGIWRNHPAMQRYLMSPGGSQGADVDWVTGALAIVRRAAVDQVGMMDERYFLYWEDMDWCYRMQQAGWKVSRAPDATAIHDHRREGVRRPFSRAGCEQVLGAIRFFCKFGWKPAAVSTGYAGSGST